MMKTVSFKRQPPPHPRRAIVTVMVLVVLMLMSGLVVAFVRRAVSDRRQMQRELDHRQTIQLALAGLNRARSEAETDKTYSGESWKIVAGTIDQTKTGVVEISVKENIATATASFPMDQEIPFKVTRTVRLSK